MLAIQKIAERRHLWQTISMKHSAAKTALGAKAFAAITAVEGLKLSAESKARLSNLKAKGLNNDERRVEIIRAYRTAR
ncbi:MAG: hypothetical protein ABL928_01040 [Sphingorhabdus sp.]